MPGQRVGSDESLRYLRYDLGSLLDVEYRIEYGFKSRQKGGAVGGHDARCLPG